MPAASFRVFYGTTPATQAQLDQLERITVEQEIDLAWEARLTLPLCVDASGAWSGADEAFLRSFSRVRVEIKVGGGPFVALIDGPIVGYDSRRSSEPGQSQITLLVQDDSVYLNRHEEVRSFPNRTDSEIAQELLQDAPHIHTTQVDETPSAPNDLPPETVQRGTAMRLLRFLARRQGLHAYVLPGDQPDQSLGCFKRLPSRASGLPDLILLGGERNIAEFNLAQDAQSPARVQAYALSLSDHSLLTSQSSVRDQTLLGDAASLPADDQIARLLARPGQGDTVDPEQRARAAAERASYNQTATGSIIPGCYAGVLLPYQLVQVRGVSAQSSGLYLIQHVTHTFDRSSYTQAFTLKRNAETQPSGGSAADLIGSIL